MRRAWCGAIYDINCSLVKYVGPACLKRFEIQMSIQSRLRRNPEMLVDVDIHTFILQTSFVTFANLILRTSYGRF